MHHTKTLLAAVLCLAFTALSSPAAALPGGVQAERLTDGLTFPVAMTQTPSGDILVSEKFGTVRLIRDGELVDEPVAQFAVKSANEAGLLGIAVMPDFEQSSEFVVTYTPSEDLDSLYLSRLRLNEDGTADKLADPWLVLPSRAEITRHFGGNVFFTEEHMFVMLSDILDFKTAQQTENLFGSALRYNHDLSIPADNPLGPDNPIYAWGFRNCFDLYIAENGRFYCGENGQSKHDQIERVKKGTNHGWPRALGYCDHYPIMERCEGMGFTEPAYEFPYRVGPTGIVVYEGDMFPEYKNHVFLGGWHSGEVHHLIPDDADGDVIVEDEEPWFILPEGPFELRNDAETEHLDQYGVTDVAIANDGAFLVLESGVDRGSIYRVATADAILNSDNIVEMGERRLKNKPPSGCSQGTGSSPASLALFMFAVLGVLLFGRRRSARPAAAAALALFVVAGTPTEADAQEFKYGAHAGMSAAMISGKNVFEAHFQPGPAVGGVARMELHKYFEVHGELLYTLKGAGLKRSTERLNLHFVELPVFATLRVPLDDWTFRFAAGGFAGYLLEANMAGNSFTENLNSFELGLAGGFGGDFRMPGDWDLTVDFRFEHGFTNLLNESEIPDYLGSSRNFTNNATMFVGVVF
jgi:glucose/arabinose dehydrogenase